MQVYTLKAFGKTSQGGNPAGVVLVADNMTGNEMQEIAAKVDFPETAFISHSKKANFRLRFFTPTEEVDLCGHGTIATFFLLRYLNIIKKGVFLQETNAGVLNIEVGERKVFMEQPSPIFGPIIDKEEVAQALGLTAKDIRDDLPVQVVSTGLADILVPITTLKALQFAKPRTEELIRLSKKYSVIGFHIFTTETVKESTAHCRNFSPLVGIKEEAATGSASGALASYFYKHDLTTIPAKLIFEQGYTMKKPSEIIVELSAKPDGQLKVMVGGTAEDVEIMTI